MLFIMTKIATKQSVAPKSTRSKAATTTRKKRPTSKPVTIRNFRGALSFLNSKTNYEKMLRVGYNATNFNLARMNRILNAIGNPQKQLKCVHIAGTKGKGSTAHMVAAMLRHAGFKTGLYTSPHFVSLTERISIDDSNVSEAEFARLLNGIAPVVTKLEKEGPTFFEIVTAAAFKYFAQNEVDFAVIETGLGGRLDSTNVIKPEVCGMTSISFDHMAQLGRTIESIAEEKAGIFKPNITVISSPQPPAAKRVLRDTAEKVGCGLRFLGDELEFSYRFECSRAAGPHNRVCLATPTTRFDHIQVPLLGEHQALNCGIALGIVDALRERGFEINLQSAIDGLAQVHVQGRLETIRTLPRTVVDAAHNAASIIALMRAIGQNITYDSMVVIFGCSSDKDIEGMLSQLQLGADKIIFTSTGTPRSADPHELLARFQEKSQKMAQAEPDLRKAYETATHCVTREDLICITGSVHLVGRAKQELVGNFE